MLPLKLKRISLRSLTSYIDLIKSSKRAILGLGIICFYLILTILASFIPYDATPDPECILAPPCWEHPLGTNEVGVDVLQSVIHAIPTSLKIGLFCALVIAIIGTTVGIIAGYFGGVVDEILSAVTDIMMVLPPLPLMIVLAAILKPSMQNVIIVISLITWPGTARLIRAQTISVKERPFIERIKIIGAGNLYILRKHILPNVTSVLFANMILTIAYAILSESVLSFFGLGDPTQLSLGTILFYAFSTGALSAGAYWYIIPPGLAISICILGFTLLGNAMDEILNPRLREHGVV